MGVPQTLPADFQDWDKTAAPPATLPADFNQWDQAATKKDWYGTPSPEIDNFLKQNPGYQFLDADPKFPNRKPGIYPMGPGNEWRNDPNLNERKGNPDQWPVDLHFGKHAYQSGKMAVMGATLPLLFEATLPQIISGLIGGTAGSYGGQKIAKSAGAGEFGQEVSGDVGGLVGGMAGSAVTSAATNYAGSRVRAIYDALPADLQDAVKTQLTKAGKDAAGAVAGYRARKVLDFFDTLSELKARFVKTGKITSDLDATGKEFPDYAGEPPPKAAPILDATGENKPFAGGMDEFTAKPMRPTVAPSGLSPVQQSAALGAIPQPMRPAYQPPAAETPGAAGSMVRSVVGPSKADPLLVRLRSIASDIEAQEQATPGHLPEEDLTGLLLQSLAQVKARKGIQ